MTVLPQYFLKYGHIHAVFLKIEYKERKKEQAKPMLYPLSRPLWVISSLIFAGLIVPTGDLQAGNEISFKRVKVGERPLGSRINIQISPEESVYDETNIKKGRKERKEKVAVAKSPNSSSGHYDWFWNDFSHDISNASLARLNDAEKQLTKAPSKSKVLSPSLANMRKLAVTYGSDILLATLDKDISPALVLAVIGVESAGKTNAVSSAGAVGLMQLIPDTAKRFNVTDSTDPKQNIAGGTAYLDWLFKEFKHDPVLALAGYNAGENAVKTHKGVPPFAETRGYIPKVVAAWQVAKALCKTPPKYATDGCVFDFNPKVSRQ